MRLLTILSLVAILYGCGAQHYIEHSKKDIKKAIRKGAVINTEIDTVIVSDTITEIFTRNDTTFVTRYIDRNVIQQGAIRYVTRVDKRREFKLEKRIQSDSTKILILQEKNNKLLIKKNAKTDRVTVRQENKKSKWWLFVIIGYLLNLAVRFVISNYLPALKRKDR